MLISGRTDGGYLCDVHEGKYAKRATKSCIRGSVKALMAFADLPEHHHEVACKALVNYFLNRQALYRMDDHTRPVLDELTSTIFPFVWRGSLLEILYALSRMGYGQAPGLERAWSILESKRDQEGRYRLDWEPTRSLFHPEKRGLPSKWVTLYAYLALKYREKA